jgi:uncharacterized SAM-binding protein YcdF (DUF218 family)
VFEPFLMPPLAVLVLGGVGWLLRKRRPLTARALMLSATALLVLASLPLSSALLLGALQRAPALDERELAHGCGAIVVLAGDAQLHAPEYGGAACGPLTLERLRYGARLARSSGLPLLVSGGPPRAGVRSHAELMREALERDFDLRVRWLEDRSADTRENLANSAELLREHDVRRVYLVTHAWHMPRAVGWARAAELDVVPAPTGFRAPFEWRMSSFLTTSKALRETTWALHEMLGLVWQALTD